MSLEAAFENIIRQNPSQIITIVAKLAAEGKLSSPLLDELSNELLLLCKHYETELKQLGYSQEYICSQVTLNSESLRLLRDWEIAIEQEMRRLVLNDRLN